MGYSLFWLAVKGKPISDILGSLELAPTGEIDEFGDSDIVSAELPTGWNLILWNKGEMPSQTDFARASADSEAVFCFVEEHVMSSLSEGWKNGNLAWSVRHNATWKKGNVYEGESFAIDGQPPDPFPAIRARLEAEQKAHNATNPPRDQRVDFIFDIPIDLAEALTGFRHDKEIAGIVFHQLKSVKSPQKSNVSFFRRIFQK